MLLIFNGIFSTIKIYFNGIFSKLKMLIILMVFRNFKDPLTML